jgi:glycosyltransferase involved in cell wall biosynthesis
MDPYAVLCLAVIDWDAPWQGAQTLALRMAADGHTVLFTETLGVRAAGRRDWRRLARRLRRRIVAGPWGFRELIIGGRPVENLWLFSPVLLPFPGRPWADRLNRRLLLASLRHRPGPERTLLWTFLPTPIVVDLVRELAPDRVVYHCVDDIAGNPAGVAPGLVEAESWLVSHADHVLTTSRSLYEARRRRNPATVYLPDGADVGQFMEAWPEPADLAALPRPRICFPGTIDERLDLELIERVAAANPTAAVVLIGPVKGDFGRLRRAPNIHLLGQRCHQVLPAYLRHSDVLIIPYRLSAYTAHIHPAKTYECLATGKPLVVTDLPELRPYAGPVVVARDQEAFLAGVAAGLAEVRESGPSAADELRAARRQIASENSWDVRYRTIRQEILERQDDS